MVLLRALVCLEIRFLWPLPYIYVRHRAHSQLTRAILSIATMRLNYALDALLIWDQFELNVTRI